MKIKNEQFFITIRSFFEVYLVKNRGCSPNTVKSYKDAINLYLDFLEETKGISVAKAGWNCFSRQFVQEFLAWLEESVAAASGHSSNASPPSDLLCAMAVSLMFASWLCRPM